MNNGHYVIATSCLYNLHWLCICICGSFLLLIAVEVVATPLASLLSPFLSGSIALGIIGGLFKTSMKACVQARISSIFASRNNGKSIRYLFDDSPLSHQHHQIVSYLPTRRNVKSPASPRPGGTPRHPIYLPLKLVVKQS